MDKHTENSLIANSGIHFKITRLKMNPEEPLVLEGGKTLKYTFIETIDFLNECRVRFDLCSNKDGSFIPSSYASNNELTEKRPDGFPVLDQMGIPVIKKDTTLALVEHYNPNTPELININSLNAYRVKVNKETRPAFELLLDKWLPMPMFEEEINGQSSGYPIGWCRVKISQIPDTGQPTYTNEKTYRLTWAFDTKLADNLAAGITRPFFDSEEEKTYSLCNRNDLLLGTFLNIPDGKNDTPISDYLVSLLGIDLSVPATHKYKFLGYYIYLINYLRLTGASPRVTLYHKKDDAIPVDMSIDIGNSRTCAVLFENGDFTKARMLRLRDLTEPWRTYENAFDMRIVFRRADFGGDITLDKSLFQWPSLIRMGEEAKHLIYRSQNNHGIAERTTNYSSPKRYLWDRQKYPKRWEWLIAEDDPTSLKINQQIYVEGFTDYIDDDGSFLDKPKEIDLFNLGITDDQCHYSRSSLMSFTMIEMLQQALCYINSSKFRDMHGSIDCRRYLRNIIITCPTAMPWQEQYTLRKAAYDATQLLRTINPNLPEMSITPSLDKHEPTDDFQKLRERGWLYDEAFANQLVYLYAELTERYNGKIEKFFQLKGHKRPELKKYGLNEDALTIGTIDIGAGTTDVMITAYTPQGVGRLTPTPLYYDSFYAAGDDILQNVIRDVVLEGKDYGSPELGSIGNSILHRIQAMGPDELLEIPRIAETKIYRDKVEAIRYAITDQEILELKRHLTHELMHHFFADNSANQSEYDRQCRLDFCTQISHPISQFFLQLLKLKRPSKLYNFQELFPEEQPSVHLLEHFQHHFGFDFRELCWRFDPEVIGNIVRDTMEPLVKALSVVMYAHHCDILVLSGRPTDLEPLNKLFLKYIPIPPHRIICLNQYRIGRWFPLSTEEGYFREDQKAAVAVGAEVGYLASTVGFRGLVLDFSSLGKIMKSTACYLGSYDEHMQEVRKPFLTPQNSSTTLKAVSNFPYFIGCKQFDAPKYQARPLYAIYNNSNRSQLNIMLQRNYYEDRELITIEDVTDLNGDSVPLNEVDIHLQTIAHDGNFWMDKGAFTLKIQEI